MAKTKKGSLLGRINPVSLGSTADASFMIEKVEEKNNDDFNLSYINSTIDYLDLGIEDDNDKNKLIILESQIRFHERKTLQHILEYSKAIYEGNKIFANNRNGNFGKWVSHLGISRETANTAIRRYILYKDKKNEKVLELPGRIVKELTGKNKEYYNDVEVIEILNSEKPMLAIIDLKTKKREEKLKNIEEKKEYLYQLIINKEGSIKRIQEEVKQLKKEYEALIVKDHQ